MLAHTMLQQQSFDLNCMGSRHRIVENLMNFYRSTAFFSIFSNEVCPSRLNYICALNFASVSRFYQEIVITIIVQIIIKYNFIALPHSSHEIRHYAKIALKVLCRVYLSHIRFYYSNEIIGFVIWAIRTEFLAIFIDDR